jgi:hypothetical protein
LELWSYCHFIASDKEFRAGQKEIFPFTNTFLRKSTGIDESRKGMV